MLQVVTDRDRRGAQVFAMDLASGLVALNVSVDTVALTKGLHGDLLPLQTLGPSRRSPATFRSLRRRAQSYDVVIAHGSATLLACALALFGSRTPFVYRQISDPLHWASSWRRRLRVAAFVRRAAGIVVLSQSVARVFGRHYRLSNERMTVIPNAVQGGAFSSPSPQQRSDARANVGVAQEALVVAYVGALVEEKGVDLAIDAIGSSDSGTLLIVGDGPERMRLERFAERVAPGRVRFTGALDSPVVAFHAADLLVLPSRAGDSMPAVLIEAGLCGLPAVTTPVGAIADVVVDGSTGRIVPVGDGDAFTAAVVELLADSHKRHELGAAAQSRCRSCFTIETTASAWLRLLEDVVRESREARRNDP